MGAEDDFVDEGLIRVEENEAILIGIEGEGDVVGSGVGVPVGDEFEKAMASDEAERREDVLGRIIGLIGDGESR